MNPRLYEATLDEFPDSFPAFKEPDNQFAMSSHYAFKSIKFPKKTKVWFSKYRPNEWFSSALQAHIWKNNFNAG